MKILMITYKDGQNASLAKIADAFLLRGHEITIYALFYAENVLQFFDERIPRFPIDNLTENLAVDYDIIFTNANAMPAMAMRKLLSIHKPIITHNPMINRQVRSAGDFCFVPSLASIRTDYDKYMQYPQMEIGEPKYDSIIQKSTDTKRFLFIDSGHYPFGTKGKKELARTLLNICKTFPDYELWIKPRFLPGDQLITHKNGLHLYDTIQEESGGKVPDNLVMLREHRDLMELIEQCCTVICMYTTAFAGAYVLGKGLVVLDNLPSEDVYDVRAKVFNNVKKIMFDSGAIIDYRRVNENLPHGVKCTDTYFRYLLAEKENTADKICEVTEYLYGTFYQKGIFPQTCDYAYHDYKNNIKENQELNWDKIVSNRYENTAILSILWLIDRRISASLDITSLINRVEEMRHNGYITESGFMQIRRNITGWHDEFFVKNRDALMGDDIDSGILLNAYYELNKYDEIINFPKQNIGAYYWFRGIVADELGESKDIVISNLEKYMSLSLERAYIKEISDNDGMRFKAFYILILALVKQKEDKDKTEYYLKKMINYYNEVYTEAKKTGVIVNGTQRWRYTCMHWAEGAVNHYVTMKEEFIGKPILVYGSGTIGKKIVLESLLKDRIVAFVDKYSNEQELDQIPIIRPEKIIDYKDVHIVLVAVLKDFENIRKDLLGIRGDIQIVPVNDLF